MKETNSKNIRKTLRKNLKRKKRYTRKKSVRKSRLKKRVLCGGSSSSTNFGDIPVPLTQKRDFFNAVINGNLDEVTKLLKEYPNMPLEMTDGDILGREQKQYGNVDNETVKLDMTPLYYAVSRNMHIPRYNSAGESLYGHPGWNNQESISKEKNG